MKKENQIKITFYLASINKVIIIYILCLAYFSIKNINSINKTNNNNITVNSSNTKYSLGRIFVSFMYNDEAEMAYIHIWRLYDYVDKFIILFSNRTFSGFPKNFSFSPFEENIRPYLNKVDIVKFNNICNKKEYPSYNPIWCFENSQRDYAKTFIEEHYDPTEDDLLVVVDIDEIFTREGIKYVRKNPPKDFYHIKGSLYFPYYYHKLQDWDIGCVIRYNKNMMTLSKYRKMPPENNTLIFEFNSSKPLITHCSYCFNDLEKYRNKIKSFSHQEFNKKPYITNNWIFKSHYCREKINSSPGYDEPYEGWRDLIPDDQRLQYLIDPSFMYPLNLTTYTEKDLVKMCKRKYNREPFK